MLTVLYENTVVPRIETIRSSSEGRAVVIDIAEEPVQLIEHLRGTNAEIDRQIDEMRPLLVEPSTLKYWSDTVRIASRVRTTLSPVGTEVAASLIRLGYLGATVACHARFGTTGPDEMPDDRWFRLLVERKTDGEMAKVHDGTAVGASA